MSRIGLSLLLLPTALLITASARAESEPESAAPTPFLKDEGSWVAGFLNPEGTIVVRPQHDLASVSPFADIGSPATPDTASFVSDSGRNDPHIGAETEPASDSLPGPLPETAALAELAVNVPDLPQIVDRMGTAVLLLSVCLVAAMVYRKRIGLRKQSSKNEPRMRVVSRMPVSRRGEICLVEIDRRLMVIGLDAQGIRTLVPLDAAAPQATTFAEIQSQVMMAEEIEESGDSTPVSPPPQPASSPLPRPLVRRRPASLFSR
jgi:flagellar biogenesis protein FliO